MNFSPFGNPFPSTLPSMHQFSTKFADPVIVNSSSMLTGQNTVVISTLSAGDNGSGGIQYIPVSTSNSNSVHATQVQGATRITTLPMASNIQVMNTTSSAGTKYSPGATVIGWENIPVHHFTTVDPKVVSVPYTQNNVIPTSSPPTMWPVRLINAGTATSELITAEFTHESEPQDLCKVIKEEKELKSDKGEEKVELIQIPLQAAWADSTGTMVADYLSRLPTSTIPISLHHFLKYPDSGKKEGLQELHLISEQHLPEQTEPAGSEQQHLHHQQQQQQQIPENQHNDNNPPQQLKKKKKKQKAKEKKPRYRPGEIRLSTALDGSTLFCCPECHMAYPERFSLEQHLAGHKMERRFVCDVCGAGLKRKEHLDQHKRGHSQERPFVCSICMKGFKRNEHLTRHYVIHSGDKSYICLECGKAFSRKDHLHKHAQTHIAKRVKAELSQQGLPMTPSVPVPAPIMS